MLALYALAPAQEKAARAAVDRRWREGSGRFRAYAVAHEIAAAAMRDSAAPGDGMREPDPPPGMLR